MVHNQWKIFGVGFPAESLTFQSIWRLGKDDPQHVILTARNFYYPLRAMTLLLEGSRRANFQPYSIDVPLAVRITAQYLLPSGGQCPPGSRKTSARYLSGSLRSKIRFKEAPINVTSTRNMSSLPPLSCVDFKIFVDPSLLLEMLLLCLPLEVGSSVIIFRRMPETHARTI